MIKYYILLIGLVFTFTACEKDDPIIPNEEEVITTLIYTLTPSSGESVEFTFQDLDGDGGAEPIITEGTLKENEIYTGSLALFSEVDGEKEDIGAEVKEEAEDHQFFFTTTVPGLTFEYTDKDADNNPVGLDSQLSTGSAGTGTMTIILRHEPNKSGTGVASGDITNAGGETDIEVTFNVNVE